MMNERKRIFGKNAIVSGMMVMTAMLSAIMMTGCGCQQRTEKAVSTSDSAAHWRLRQGAGHSLPRKGYFAECKAYYGQRF